MTDTTSEPDDLAAFIAAIETDPVGLTHARVLADYNDLPLDLVVRKLAEGWREAVRTHDQLPAAWEWEQRHG